jgi:catechol 2,3-dioxygenase-like lactoylglutathione lyase family enzyme
MFTQGLHHAAYRCLDAQQTVDFYTKVLKLPYIMAFSEDRVPSTKEPDPYMHIFFDLGDGSALAFFELPNSKPPQKDPNTPAWVQHIAFKVADESTLMQAKAHAEQCGLDVLGPTDHGLFKSIYFFDPNGHRLELACNTATPEMFSKASAEAPAMLAQWNTSKKVVGGTHWLHAKELDPK